MRTLKELVCPHILQMQAYSSARSEFKGNATVFLDANENAFQTAYNRYPDPLQSELKEEVAKLKNINTNQVFFGNGSDEAIDLLVRIFCKSGEDAIITLPPTYGMYAVSANLCHVTNIEVPLIDNFQPDVDAILAAQNTQTKLLFICSPNNPTGNNIDLEKIKTLLKIFDGIVVVDEAYIDFSEQASCLNWLAEYPNLVILQTFSKAWGMAGIRLGMAFSSVEIIGLFNKVKPPYNVNSLTQEFALERLRNSNNISYDVLQILAQKKALKQHLEQLPFVQKVYPSAANFLLIKVDEPTKIYTYLVEHGIVIRNRNTVLLCAGCLRITVGNNEENELLKNALLNYININNNEQKSIVPRPRWDFSH